MKQKIWFTGFCLGLITLCSSAFSSTQKSPTHNQAHFSWFDYSGNDAVFNQALGNDKYQNPILAGFHPDPSVVRVGEDFYLVNSTFGFFPGIPIFHSRDLVKWTQIGNAIHRPEQLPYKNVALAQLGVYAATIEYRNGTFYVINTCVGCGGNFVVTATNPAGPWSDPIWLPKLEGIDPSIFFDDEGKTYIVHHRNPSPQKYPAHTALWVMQVDSKTFQPISDDVMLVDGSAKVPWHTEYIEGPHIYKVDGTYYLSAPGGGTGYFHGQLVYKSKNIFGPYTANPDNPILTQFGLPDNRENPVTATGHADMFDDGKGNWWAVFLGTRIYDLDKKNQQDPGNFHTGRETFMLPVTWKDGWPIILEKDKAVPYQVKKPNLPTTSRPMRAMTGNFSVREKFSEKTLAPHWLFIRAPLSQWWSTGSGELILTPREDQIGEYGNPSFIGRRLAHMTASFGTKLTFYPQSPGEEAGLLAVQTDEFYYAFGLSENVTGDTVLRVRKRAGKDTPVHGETIIEKKIKLGDSNTVFLRANIDKAKLGFEYSVDGKQFTSVIDSADSRVLTSAMAGGFTGAVVGMYAELSTD
ncbi:MAG TPA: glycoside hydrolase 43 family protein [Cellvibrio sp.]|jgi:xylan 1,4-beta-xylosidase|nr:glycoside hydrolase 43 family protein [Cellvibrio sp.]